MWLEAFGSWVAEVATGLMSELRGSGGGGGRGGRIEAR